MTELAEQSRTWSAPSRPRALPATVLRPRDQRPVADDALDVLDQHRLSPAELRILLALGEGDVELNALARSFERPPIDVRRAAARLYARGFLRWRYSPRPGMSPEKEEILGIREAGRSIIRRRPPLSVRERDAEPDDR